MSCPRCSGTMREQSDIFGSYVSCYQCGYLKDLQIVESLANVNLKEFNERTEAPSIPNKAIQGETSRVSDEEPASRIQARPPIRITKDPREYKKSWVQRKRRRQECS